MNKPPFFNENNSQKNNNMSQEKKFETFEEISSELMSSGDVVCASDEQEFFYKDTNESVPCGEPIGIDLPVYDFDFLKYEIDEDDNSRDANKFSYNASQEYEALINDWIVPKEIKLVLFKNIYWRPNYEEK